MPTKVESDSTPKRFFSQKNIGGLDDIELQKELERVNNSNKVSKEVEQKPTTDISDSMEYIKKRLVDVRRFGLEIEVIAFSIKAMKQDPTMSIEDAFECGCEEWDI